MTLSLLSLDKKDKKDLEEELGSLFDLINLDSYIIDLEYINKL